uniref:NADH-ubiquinone oxidoreductase chain 3 n=1 Tax=Phloiophilus edwardsi TaxID=295730 RepID=A0A0S2MR19_9CUCU|nr:NADH deshydrogenase subunit 3 [Phloiophilus edwardsi]
MIKLLMYISSISIILPILLMIMSSILSKKSFYDREKSSPFECGFDPNSSPRMPFSLHFFLIAIIFLIFDVEITLLLPLISVLKTTKLIDLITMMTIFLLILLLGTYYEWKTGALNWAN